MSHERDYACTILEEERQKIKKAIKKLTHDFCTAPSYEQYKKGIEAMTVEEYDKKEFELIEKLASLERALATIHFRP